jgi:hypothetical protein
MGYDKYGLDWSLWGNTPKKYEKKSFDPSATIGSGWANPPKNLSADDDNADPVSQPQPLTCTLSNARFLPDETTGFNKPCKITVDVEGTPKGKISFALWAAYKNEQYDLQEVQTAFVKDGKAQAELKLFYVDQHYDDINYNGDDDAVVEYYAKVSNKAAREIKSELLKMPLAAPVGGLVELYFADKHGEKIKKVDHGDTVFLILKTKGMIGHIIDINLEDKNNTYKSRQAVIKDSILKDFKITDNTEKIKLKVV